MSVCILATGAGAEGEAVLFQARELETRQVVISTVRRNARGGRRRDLTRSISWPDRARVRTCPPPPHFRRRALLRVLPLALALF